VIPPLRERLEDIPAILEARRSPFQWQPDAIDELLRYDWPGNVRQLENVMEAAEAWAEDAEVRASQVRAVLATQPVGAKPRSRHERAQKVVEALRGNGGVIAAAARSLRVCENTVRRDLKKLKLNPSELR